MTLLYRVPLLLAGLLLVVGIPLRGQEAFSHESHDPLFPLCAGCHPGEAGGAMGYPTPESCANCHDGDQARPVRWSPPAGDGLDHRFHAETGEAAPACGACHGAAGDDPVSVAATCTACHEAHHSGGIRCRACHGQSPRSEHTAAAHAGCGGAGCHEDAAATLTFDRELCLVCHQDMVDHRPGRACGRCHAVGQPGS